jgi:hypothetical protein
LLCAYGDVVSSRRRQLKARAAEARATAQRRREEMKARGAKMEDDLAA